MTKKFNSLIVLFLIIIKTTTSKFFLKRFFDRSESVLPVDAAPNEYTDEDEQFRKKIESALKALESESVMDSAITKTKKSISKIKNSIVNKFKRFKNTDKSGEEQFKEYIEKEEKKEDLPDKTGYPNPGISGFIKKEAIERFKDIYLGVFLTYMLSEPLQIQYQYDPIFIEDIYIGLDKFNISEVEVVLDEDNQEVLFFIQETPIQLILNTNIMVKSKTLKGNIAGNFNIEPFILKFKFLDDPKNLYFKPRILFGMNRFKIANGTFDIKATFKNIPDFLLKFVLYLFENKIVKEIQNYIIESFVKESSDLLNWVIDMYYPSNLDLLGDDSRLDLRIVRPPLIKNDALHLEMLGEFFDIENYNDNADNFVPTIQPTEMFVPAYAEDSNLGIAISEGMLVRTLQVLLNKRLIELPTYVYFYNQLKIDITTADVAIKDGVISIDRAKLFFYYIDENVDTRMVKNLLPKYIKQVSLKLTIDQYNLEKGFLSISVHDSVLIENDAEQHPWTYQIRSLLDYAVNQVLPKFTNGDYELYPVELNDGSSLSPILFNYENGFISAKSNVLIDVSKSDFIEQMDRIRHEMLII